MNVVPCPHCGQPYDADRLLPRERAIIARLGQGGTNPEIAAELGIKVATVRTHLHHIYRKTGYKTRLALGLAYLRDALAKAEAKRDVHHISEEKEEPTP